ncbi:MAG TPA: hypothetical protein VET65_01565 [Candidatus Limnocylindrales bacterium]|nr:hypothetical protein [Candidatus Limnocylindrales bacterium]
MLLRVRAHMSAMAGYASMLENVSPRIQGEILAVMAQKSQELVSILQPITNRRRASAATIQDYREVRLRARELLVEYRTLVERLNDQVQQAHQSIEGLGHPG